MSVSSPSSVSVLLADPNDVARAGLKAWLTEDPRFAIAGDTSGDAVAAAGCLRPDVIVVDPLTRQGFDVRMITDLAAIAPDSRICVYTNGYEPRSFLDAMLAGAQAYLLKHNTSGELLREALVLAGRFAAVVVDPLIAEHFRTRASGELILNAVEPETETLTARERQVLALLVEGAVDKDIAAQLGISLSTVQYHVRSIGTKLGARTRLQLGVVVAQQRLIVD